MKFFRQSFLTALMAIVSLWGNAQNIGIGTDTPLYKLTIKTQPNNWGMVHTDGNVSIGSFIYSSGIGELGTRSNHPFYLFANNMDNPAAINIGVDSKVGILTQGGPKNFLQVGSVGSSGYTNYQVAFGNGAQATGFGILGNGNSTWQSTLNLSLMPTNGSGYVGVNTQAPSNFLQIGSTPGFSGNHIAIGNGTQVMSFFQSATTSNWYSNTSFALLGASGAPGYVGINTPAPSNFLQIDSTPGFTGNHIAIGNGTQIMSFFQSSTISNWYSNTAFALVGVNGGSGYLGVNTRTPVNKLQIGSVGATGYAGNDIAFGNGAQASAIVQTAGMAEWYSNTNIALMPQGNGHGRVGINTTSPIAPLEVDDYVQLGTGSVSEAGDGYAYLKPGTNFPVVGFHAITDFCENCNANVSIYATGNIMATEIDAVSDARVKDIHEESNGEEDLKTINKLQVKNYNMKDRVRYGNKPYKKVIAQQVEEVYPQIVNKIVNYIPNVYQLCSNIEKNGNDFLLNFNTAHHISRDAQKLQVIDGKGIQQRYEIVAVPSDNQVLINAPGLLGDTIFVYGQQVNDFRTLDYDGLTTLNISATQEITRRLNQQQLTLSNQQAQIEKQNKKIDQLEEIIKKYCKKNK